MCISCVYRQRARSPHHEMVQSPSPRRFPQHPHYHHPHHHHHHHHDIGFSDTVSNVVEIVKQEHAHERKHSHIRGKSTCCNPQCIKIHTTHTTKYI